jgi:hypothetical protein
MPKVHGAVGQIQCRKPPVGYDGRRDVPAATTRAKGVGMAGHELHEAFDKLTDFAIAPAPGKGAARVFDHARRLYRESIRAYREGDPTRAGEWAAAAHDAARGVEHVRRVTAPPVAELPEPRAEFTPAPGGQKGKGPPPIDGRPAVDRGPWSEALDVLAVALSGWRGSATARPGTHSTWRRRRTPTPGRLTRRVSTARRRNSRGRPRRGPTSPNTSPGPAGTAPPPPTAPERKRKGPGAPPQPPAIKD